MRAIMMTTRNSFELDRSFDHFIQHVHVYKQEAILGMYVDMFSPVHVSTMTCVGNLYDHKSPPSNGVNIYTIAKYLELDHEIVGVRFSYAGGQHTISRGCFASESIVFKQPFHNQVTMCFRVPNRSLMSIKIFHNGAVQLTGAKSLEEAQHAVQKIVHSIHKLDGYLAIGLLDNVSTKPYVSHDHCVYSKQGRIVGYKTIDDYYYIQGELTMVDSSVFSGHHILVSKKWSMKQKNLYTLDGEYLGKMKLVFGNQYNFRHVKHEFVIENFQVAYKDTCIGKVDLKLVPQAYQFLESSTRFRHKFANPQCILSTMFPLDPAIPVRDISESFFTIHNINAKFVAQFELYRASLHQVFLDEGLYSRFESCSRLGVNLRYMECPEYPRTHPKFQPGVCQCSKQCRCRTISFLCFHSGKIVVTGFKSLDDIPFVTNFVQSLIAKHQSKIQIPNSLS